MKTDVLLKKEMRQKHFPMCWLLTVQVCPTKKTIRESVKRLVINNTAHVGKKKEAVTVSWGVEMMKIHH